MHSAASPHARKYTIFPWFAQDTEHITSPEILGPDFLKQSLVLKTKRAVKSDEGQSVFYW